MTDWDFSKLPKKEYNACAKLYLAKNTGLLLDKHNTYNLSEYDYCCGEHLDSDMQTWWGEWYNKIYIKWKKEESAA